LLEQGGESLSRRMILSALICCLLVQGFPKVFSFVQAIDI